MKSGVLLAGILVVGFFATAVAEVTPLSAVSLSVSDPEVSGDLRWIDGEAEGEPRVSFYVNNTGSTPVPGYIIEYEWVDSNGVATPLKGSQQESTDVSKEGLEKDGSNHHVQEWDLQPEHQGSGAVRVTVSLVPARTIDWNIQKDASTFIPVHDLELTVPGDSQAIRQLETKYHRIEVTNHGNQDEEVSLGVTDRQIDVDPGEDVDPENIEGVLTDYLQFETLTVPPGTTRTSDLFIDYGNFGDAIAFNVTHELLLETGYERTLSLQTPAIAGVSGTVPPGSPFVIERIGSSGLHVPLGGSLTKEFRIVNTGDSSDTYRVTALPAVDWSAVAQVPGATEPPEGGLRAALEPGQSMRFQVEVQAPDGATPGTPGDMTVRVASDRRPDETTDHVWQYRVQGPAVRIEPGAGWNETTYLGDAVDLGVQIHNDGDQPTPDSGKIHLFTVPPSDPVASLDVSPIGPGNKTDWLSIGEGVHEVSGPVRFTVEWDSSPVEIHSESLEREVFIRDPAITLAAPEPLSGFPGETVGYRTGDHTFVAENLGNAMETIHATVVAEHGDVWLVSSQGTFQLAPGQESSIPIDHRLPAHPGTAMEANVSLHISIEGRPDLDWTASVSTGIQDVVAPELETVSQPTEWATGTPLTLTVVATDASVVDGVQVNHTDPTGQHSIHDMVPSGNGTQQWTYTVTPDAGDHAFTFAAEDMYGNRATLETDDLQVRPFPPPTVEILQLDPGDEVSPEDSFKVRVTDTLPIQDLTVRTTNDTGAVIWERSMDPTAKSITFDFTGTPEGNATVTIVAVNSEEVQGSTSVKVAVVPPSSSSDGSSSGASSGDGDGESDSLQDASGPSDGSDVPTDEDGDGKATPTPVLLHMLAITTAAMLRQRKQGGEEDS